MKKIVVVLFAILVALMTIVCVSAEEETTLAEVETEAETTPLDVEKEIADLEDDLHSAGLSEEDIKNIVQQFKDAYEAEKGVKDQLTLSEHLVEAWSDGDIPRIIIIVLIMLVGFGIVETIRLIRNSIKKALDKSDKSADTLVSKLNEVVTAYNEFVAKYAENNARFDEALTKVESVETSNEKTEKNVASSLAKYGEIVGLLSVMLKDIYSNSSTISKSAKESAVMKCNEIQKLLEDTKEI